MNTTIICPHCKKPFEISDAIQHQIEDELLRAKTEQSETLRKAYGEAAASKESEKQLRGQLKGLLEELSKANTAQGAERARLLKQQDKLSAQAKELSAYEEKVHHLADRNITIDLDDGVKKNYEIFADVLAKI
jgi:hypothetical protein